MEDSKKAQLPDDVMKAIQETTRAQRDELPFQLKVYDDSGKGKLVPGFFRRPSDVYYGLDLFVDLDVYDLLCDIVERIGLSAREQLEVVLVTMNHSKVPKRYIRPITRAEVIDRRDGSVVTSSEVA